MGIFDQRCKDELVDMSTGQCTLGVVLWIISSAALIPSLTKPWQNKSTFGLSAATVIMTNIQQTLQLANTIIMKWDQIPYCKENFWGCQPSLIQLYTACTGCALLFVQYQCVVWFPEPNDEANRRFVRKAWLVQIVGCSALLIFSVVWSMSVRCNESDALRIFGIVSGLLSAILIFVRFAPQLYLTIQSRSSGGLSKRTYFIVGTGGFLQTYFQVFGSKEEWSTWLPVFVGNCVQTAILCLCLFYDYVLPPTTRAVRAVSSFARKSAQAAQRRLSEFSGRSSRPSDRDSLRSSFAGQSLQVQGGVKADA